MITRGDEIEEKGASVLQAIPSTAASYTTIGIGERHTGQACVLGSLEPGVGRLNDRGTQTRVV
jgi:hypothetical protein